MRRDHTWAVGCTRTGPGLQRRLGVQQVSVSLAGHLRGERGVFVVAVVAGEPRCGGERALPGSARPSQDARAAAERRGARHPATPPVRDTVAHETCVASRSFQVGEATAGPNALQYVRPQALIRTRGSTPHGRSPASFAELSGRGGEHEPKSSRTHSPLIRIKGRVLESTHY